MTNTVDEFTVMDRANARARLRYEPNKYLYCGISVEEAQRWLRLLPLAARETGRDQHLLHHVAMIREFSDLRRK